MGYLAVYEMNTKNMVEPERPEKFDDLNIPYLSKYKTTINLR
jgi:hypothetical protein